jgi:hypothetical protein
MSKRYTYSGTITFGHDGEPGYSEVEVTVSYSVAWGSPETGRYSGPPENYDPGSPSVVEDIKLEKVEDKPRPWDMGFGNWPDDEFEKDVIERLEAHEDRMIAEASEEEAYQDEQAREHQYEARREMARESDNTGQP